MNLNDLGVYLGIKLPDLVAGMFGGIVKALVFHRDKPLETVVCGIVGGLVANYLGESVAAQLSSGRGATCFAVGIAAMVICQAIIDRARSWSPKTGGENGRP